MAPDSSNTFAREFLKGALDVFEALLALSFRPGPSEPTELDVEELVGHLSRWPVVLRAELGDSGVALLFSARDAARLIQMLDGAAEPSLEAPRNEDLETLREVAESALRGGASRVAEQIGQEMALRNVNVTVRPAMPDRRSAVSVRPP